MRKASPGVILAALEQQRPGLLTRPSDRIPYPATWLNAENWLNEVDAAADADIVHDEYAKFPGYRPLRRDGSYALPPPVGWATP